MSALLIPAVYGAAVLLAAAILYYYEPKPWYLHLLSLVAAFAVGLMPTPEGWHGKAYDLTAGFLFVFLFLWGIGGAVFRFLAPRRRERHA
jgi:hypothetical protein